MPEAVIGDDKNRPRAFRKSKLMGMMYAELVTGSRGDLKGEAFAKRQIQLLNSH